MSLERSTCIPARWRSTLIFEKTLNKLYCGRERLLENLAQIHILLFNTEKRSHL